MNYISKASTLTKNILKNSPGLCKKSGCSLCKSENPLYKNIPSEKKILLAIIWAHRRSKFEGWGCCWSTYLKTCVKAVACHGLSLLLARHTRCSSQRLKLTGILESFQTKEYLDLTFHYTALFSRLGSALGISILCSVLA